MTRDTLTGAVPGFIMAAIFCLGLEAWGVAAACLGLAAIIIWRAPIGDGLSSLRDQARSGLAPTGVNPSRTLNSIGEV